MDESLRNKFMGVSVATLATALFKRGLRNQVIQGVNPVKAKGVNMVGPAYTLRYIPAREDRNQLSEFRNPEHPQRVAVEQCPPGHVLVMDSRKDARAATAGSILITRLALRGAAGVVSDGGFRDVDVGKRFAKIDLCRGGETVCTLTQINLIEINLEDLVLAQVLFNLDREQGFINFSFQRLFAR